MNILILDTDNRDVVSLVYHYRHLGHQVYFPKIGTPGSKEMTPLWTRLLFKTPDTVSRTRWIDVFGVPQYDSCKFGEDRFLSREISEINPYFEDNVYVDFIDIIKEGNKINAYHTTPNCVGCIEEFLSIAKQYMPKAKWISSSINHFEKSFVHNPKNVVRWLPANYKNTGKELNSCDFYRHPFEFSYLDVNPLQVTANDATDFVSFNHNYAQRQPVAYKLFCEVNAKLQNCSIINYGGNIRRHGADIACSGQAGVTGHFETLSPRQAMLKYVSSLAIVHLKEYDWSGGVPAWSRIAGKPIIVLKGYVDATKSHDHFMNNINCFVVDSDVDQICEAIYTLKNNKELVTYFGNNNASLNTTLFSTDYWNSWQNFL